MTDSLVDGFGRVHRSLRVSVTDRCDLRCTYCMPAAGLDWLAASERLTVEETLRAVAVAVGLGITKVRLTGGEPLLAPGLLPVVRGIAALDLRPDIALTTNGTRLTTLAVPLRAAGVSSVTVSLDTLREDRFALLTRRRGLGRVLAGIEAAVAAGLVVKANAVLRRGTNDDEVLDLLGHCVERGIELRFIETMPLNPDGSWDRAAMVTGQEVLDTVSGAYGLTPTSRGSRPAERWLLDGGPAAVGVIRSVSAPFCAACDRLRLTSDGQLRACLFSSTEYDLRALLRDPTTTPLALAELFRDCLRGKRAAHDIGAPGFRQPARAMSAIGG